MPNFLVALVIVIGGWWMIRQFANTQPAKVRGLIRKIAGGAIIAFAGLMAMRGGMNIAMPLFVLGAGLLGQNMVFPGGMPWEKGPANPRARMVTGVLAVELDQVTGAMDGDVLSGPLKGRKLSSLTPDDIRQLHRQCATTPDQSRALLESWLDRSRAGWRESWGRGERAPAASSGKTSPKEALAILGLKDGASADEIRAAHRRLMKDFHPDHGGSDYLAAKINEAKDVLLQELGART